MTPEEKKAYKKAPKWIKDEFKARRLREAAPELLKACKLALIHLDQCHDFNAESAQVGAQAIAAIRNAIRHAEPN
jgi:hypothetical protein